MEDYIKQHLVAQLQSKLRLSRVQAENQALEAAKEAKTGAQRAINLAKATLLRATEAKQNYDVMDQFKPKPKLKNGPITLGCIVEIEDGDSGKTVFIAPTGAGLELTGPGDDGDFLVVTPSSPLGKNLLGKRIGDSFDLYVGDDVVEYTITYAY